MPRFSVVICSLNGESKIASCLTAVVAGTTPCELIVVDDGSTDGTAVVAQQFGATVIRNDANKGLSASRNIGWRAATGDVVAFTDDDCTPDSRWLEALARPYASEPRCVGVGGPAESADRSSSVHRFLHAVKPLAPLEAELNGARWTTRLGRYVRANLAAPQERAQRRTVHSLVGANMSFRRTALEAIGGFDDRITFGGDEEDLCGRVRMLFGEDSILYETEALMGHRFEGTVVDIVRRARGYGRGNARRVLKSGGLPPLLPFPWIILGALLASVRSPRWVAVAAALPVVLYFRGGHGRSRTADHVVQPYLSLLQEAATMGGFAEGWFMYRSQYRREV